MRTTLVRIGNSRGVRIPKALLEQCKLGETVELEVQNNQIVIRSADRPREGWGEAFREMAERGDDTLLDEDSLGPTAWDQTEWEW